MGKQYNRWTGQYTGQAASTGTDFPATDAGAAVSDITAANYQQALSNISTSTGQAAATTSMSPTTMVLLGVAGVGLLWFLTRK